MQTNNYNWFKYDSNYISTDFTYSLKIQNQLNPSQALNNYMYASIGVDDELVLI